MSSFTGRFPSSTSPSLSCCSCRLPSGHPPAYRIRLLVAGVELHRPTIPPTRHSRNQTSGFPLPAFAGTGFAGMTEGGVLHDCRHSLSSPRKRGESGNPETRIILRHFAQHFMGKGPSPLRPEADPEPLPGLLSRIVLAPEGAGQGCPCGPPSWRGSTVTRRRGCQRVAAWRAEARIAMPRVAVADRRKRRESCNRSGAMFASTRRDRDPRGGSPCIPGPRL